MQTPSCGCMHHALGMLRLVRLGSRLVPFRLAATARAMSASPKLWIDTDAGVDDAQGILLALAHHQTELVGISAVHGNAGPKQVASNVARLLTLAGRTDVPVHLGADKALDGSSGSAPQWFGRDGFGDRPDAEPASSSIRLKPAPGHAASAIAAAARQHQGELVLLAIGPLTNVALACGLDSALVANLKQLVVMGASTTAGEAEMNFAEDALAAQAVLGKFRGAGKLRLVTWDCSLEHCLPWSWVLQTWLSGSSRKAAFMAAIMGITIPPPEKRGGGGYPACDALAAAVAVEPACCLQSVSRVCLVDCAGTPGSSIFHTGSESISNVDLVTKLDLPRIQTLLQDSLR